MKKVVLKALNTNTKGGFAKWLQKYNTHYNKAEDHDMLVIDEKLDKNDFVLILTTKAVSKNLFYQAKASNYPFLAFHT